MILNVVCIKVNNKNDIECRMHQRYLIKVNKWYWMSYASKLIIRMIMSYASKLIIRMILNVVCIKVNNKNDIECRMHQSK